MSDNEILSPSQQRIAQIKAVCAMAGCPGKAGQLISQGRDVGSVLQLFVEATARSR